MFIIFIQSLYYKCIVLLRRVFNIGCRMLQAMKLGVPVIARNNVAHAAIIKHQATGLLYTVSEVRSSELSCIENAYLKLHRPIGRYRRAKHVTTNPDLTLSLTPTLTILLTLALNTDFSRKWYADLPSLTHLAWDSRIFDESHALTPHSGNLTHFPAQRKTIFFNVISVLLLWWEIRVYVRASDW